MCGSCYEDNYIAEFGHEAEEIQKIRLRLHAYRIWDSSPFLLPPFAKAADANTLENRVMYMARPKSWYGKFPLMRSTGEMISSGAALRELTDAVGQDAATQYIEEHR